MNGDLDGMACPDWIAAISAAVDGEDPGVDRRLLAAHLESCAGCRGYRDQLGVLTRAAGVGPTRPMPDLSSRVSTRNAVADRAGRSWRLRALLAVVAIGIIVVSIPALLGRGHDESIHEARHLGAFSVAYAVALLLVVIRPARARAIFPVTVVLAGALLITATIDVAEGHVPLVNEAAHLPELVSVLLVWLLARPLPSSDGRSRAAGEADAPLRLVDPDDGSDARRHRPTG